MAPSILAHGAAQPTEGTTMSDEAMNPIVTYFGSSAIIGALMGLVSMWQWGWFAG